MKYPIKPDFTNDELALIECVLDGLPPNNPTILKAFKMMTGQDEYATALHSILDKLTRLDE